MSSTMSSIERTADYIYYDINIKNLGNPDSRDDILPLSFEETRTSPIVEKANDYSMSITRFYTDTYSLPVYEADILPGSTDPNEMVHNIQMAYRFSTNPIGRQVSSIVNLEWIPSDKTVQVPIPPSQTSNNFQTPSTKYYYAYDYEHFIRIINNGLATAFNEIKALALITPALYPPNFQNMEPPFMGWQQDTNMAVMYARLIFNQNRDPASVDILNPIVDIFFNPTLYSLFNSFSSNKEFVRDVFNKPLFDFPYYKLSIDNFNGYRVRQGLFDQQTERFIEFPQLYSTISTWSPVSSIIFTSNTLPIIVNSISEPKLTLNNQTIQLNQAGNSFAMIISDLITNQQSYRGDLIYYPSAEYRMISLVGASPITQVDLHVYWRNKRNGRLEPFYLASGGSCSMKILFKAKKAL